GKSGRGGGGERRRCAEQDRWCFEPPRLPLSQPPALFLAAGRDSSAAGNARGGGGCARLWESDGDPDGQWGCVFRRAVFGESARVLRECRPAAAGQVAQEGGGGRSHSDGGWPHGSRWDSWGDVFERGADEPERACVGRGGADR